MQKLLIVFVCGGLGSGVRYLLGGWVQPLLGPRFPYGTVTVNVLGSFLIALVMAISLSSSLINTNLRLALTTGFMGGFTTYSTFNYESLAFFQQGAVALGVLNIAVTVVFCLAAGLLGLWCGRWLVGA